MKKGSKMTEEQCNNIKKGLKRRFPNGQPAHNKGKSNYWCIGEKNVNWKGGRTHEDKLRLKKEYLKRIPDRLKLWKRQYHETHKKDPNYLLTINIRKMILKRVGSKTEKSRQSSVQYLGCSIGEMKTYLEGKFKDGMNWENHGQYGWHIDHVVPLAFFDLTKEKDRIKVFHYTNLQPLWAQENLRKAAKYAR